MSDGKNVYYLEGGLRRVSVDGGTPVLFAADQDFSKLAIDDKYVFASAFGARGLVRIPK